MKIAFLTDSHIDEPTPKKHGADTRKNWEAVLKEIRKISPDLIIFGGDIGTVGSHPYFFDSLSQFNLKLVLGNHDAADDVAKCFPQPVKADKLYYAFQEMDHTLVFLDSSEGKISDEQLTFLKSQLKGADKILLFIHHPILPVDSPVDVKYPLSNRGEVIRILREFKNPVGIFCGHNHCEDETTDANISQFMTSAVSYQILKHHRKIVSDVSYFAYRLIHLSPEGFVTNEVRLNP